MKKSYILSFASVTDRDDFVRWCSDELEHCKSALTSAGNRPDVTLTNIAEHDLAAMQAAPQKFKVYEDVQLKPSSGSGAMDDGCER
jgi:hypothetical protein